MADEKRTDDVDKFLSEQKQLDDRKQALVDELLKQRETAMATFDEKLAKLGYRANSRKVKRSHHKKSDAEAAAKPPSKPKS